ncbi:hypothetical protein EON65_16315 [archaeon]|nr:MAG: hypothetical protein EON65_16315 [archaeon]
MIRRVLSRFRQTPYFEIILCLHLPQQIGLRRSMVKHLDPDYFVSTRPTGFIAHFWDTIDALGGYKGLFLISVGVLLFYFIVNYTIYKSREKREAAKQKKAK